MKFAAALLFALLAAAPLQAQPVELRLAYIDLELRPFLTGEGDETPAQPGMAVELVQRCLKRLNTRLTLDRMPLRRLIEEVRSGRQDGILGYRYTPERAADLVYPMRGNAPDIQRHVVRLSYSLYRRAGEAVTWDGETLTGLKNPVAVTASELNAEALAARGIPIVRVESNPQMFGMLALRRVDAVVTLDVLGDRELRAQQAGQTVEKLPLPLASGEFYLPVSRRFYQAHPDFTERLWRLLAELRETTYAELTPVYLF